MTEFVITGNSATCILRNFFQSWNFLNPQFSTLRLFLQNDPRAWYSKILRTSDSAESSGRTTINSRFSRSIYGVFQENVRRSFRFGRNFFTFFSFFFLFELETLVINVGEAEAARKWQGSGPLFLRRKSFAIIGHQFRHQPCPSSNRHLRRHSRISLLTERLVINRRTC